MQMLSVLLGRVARWWPGRRVALIVAFGVIGGPVATAAEMWPGTTYSAEVPTLAAVVGHAPGERISSHAEAVAYLEALAQAAPDRMRLWTYAESWEGRELVVAAIGNPDNIANLDDTGAAMRTLAAPAEADAATVNGLLERTPGTTWLAYAVHGNEISSVDAALFTAYHLLAAVDDPVVDEILAHSVVFIDPIQNPDGRDRFVHAFEMAEGLVPDPDRFAAEHTEPWPSGRVNHYTFDLNRDWLALTQPETQGRVAELLRWYPLVFVDLHEMGSDSTYYFAPEAVPYNPHIVPSQREKLAWFGRNNAHWFDRYGFDYFTREIFDAFYPGYGASWPLYYGAIAMTYEQASPRGLVVRQRDGNELTYWQAVRHHFVTSIATAQTTARNREAMLRDFVDYRRSAIAAGEAAATRSYIFPGTPDPSAAQKLAGLLMDHGVEVQQTTAALRACGTDYEAGTLVVNAAQPAHQMVRTLLDPDVPMDQKFLAEQERRRSKDLPDEIYDVTAWSLPLMFNVDMDRCNRAVGGALTPAAPQWVLPGAVADVDEAVAYLAPWGTQAAGRLLAQALRAGLVVRSADAAFELGGVHYPSGTLIFRAATNPADLGATLADLARTSGASITGVADSWVDEGPNFGSPRVVTIPAARVALLWDVPAGTYSAGHTRFVLERQFGYPVTAIRGAVLGRADLRQYDVIILPDGGFWGSYSDVLGERGAQRLKRWVEQGGTLIAMARALRWVTDPAVDLLDARREDAWRAEKVDAPADEATVPGQRLGTEEAYAAAIQPSSEAPDAVSGVLARAAVDGEHWLGAGLPETLNVLVQGSDIYRPLTLDQGNNVVRFQAADELLVSGYLWEENRQQLAFKPYVMVQERGAGHVIGFAGDPNYRAYLDGQNLLFLNAVFRGAAQSSRLR